MDNNNILLSVMIGVDCLFALGIGFFLALVFLRTVSIENKFDELKARLDQYEFAPGTEIEDLENKENEDGR